LQAKALCQHLWLPSWSSSMATISRDPASNWLPFVTGHIFMVTVPPRTFLCLMTTSIPPTSLDALLLHRSCSYPLGCPAYLLFSCGRIGIRDNDVPEARDFSPMTVGSLRNESIWKELSCSRHILCSLHLVIFQLP
jgi:hypothetical protein